MTEVESFHKPEPGPCACGCGLLGRPKVKAWANGVRCNKGCQCRRCVGGRQTGKARRRENRIARELGLERSVLSGALNGADLVGYLEIEETSNVAIVRGLRRWWGSQQVRAKVARLYARPGTAPKAFVASWDGRPRLVVMEYEDAARLALAASTEPEAS